MRTSKVAKVIRQAILSRHNVLLTSEPGIGKTSLVRQAVDEIEEGFRDGSIPVPTWVSNPDAHCRLLTVIAVVKDPTDPSGLPWVVVREGSNPEAIHLPFSDLKKMLDNKDLLVVLLDDFGQAPPLVQAGYMQILLAREINGHRIGDGVTFVACTNRRGDNAGVQGILDPVKDRFWTILNVEANWEDWTEAAIAGPLKGKIHPMVIAYHRWCGHNDKDKNHLSMFKPTKDMTRSPSPRAWEMLSDILQANYPKDCLREMFMGTVGKEESDMFHSFMTQYLDLVHPDVIIHTPDTATIPTKSDVMWSVLTALGGRVDLKNWPAICKYAMRLASEWSTYLVKDCVRRHPELKKTKCYIDWELVHQEIQI